MKRSFSSVFECVHVFSLYPVSLPPLPHISIVLYISLNLLMCSSTVPLMNSAACI